MGGHATRVNDLLDGEELEGGKSMTLRIRTAALGMFGTGVALFLATAPTSGHHEPGAKFDPAKPITPERNRLED